MPPGVINMLPGDGLAVSEVALAHPDLAGIHFTGSTPTFQHLWAHGRRRTSPATAPTRASWARPAARTSSSRTPRRTPTCCGWRCSAARSSSRGRSARRPRAPTSPSRCGSKMRKDFLAEVDAICDGRRHRLLELHGRRHRRPCLRQAQEGDRAGQAVAEPRHRRGRRQSTTRSATSCGRPSWSRGDPTDADVHDRVLRPDPRRARLRRRRLREGRGPGRVVRAVRPDGRGHRPGPQRDRVGAPSTCASRPATSTSTTSRPVRSSASSPSAAGGRPAPTTRPAPRPTCCAGPRPRSIKETFDPPKDYRYPFMG